MTCDNFFHPSGKMTRRTQLSFDRGTWADPVGWCKKEHSLWSSAIIKYPWNHKYLLRASLMDIRAPITNTRFKLVYIYTLVALTNPKVFHGNSWGSFYSLNIFPVAAVTPSKFIPSIICLSSGLFIFSWGYRYIVMWYKHAKLASYKCHFVGARFTIHWVNSYWRGIYQFIFFKRDKSDLHCIFP